MCLNKILDQCNSFSKLLSFCGSPMSDKELGLLQSIAKVSVVGITHLTGTTAACVSHNKGLNVGLNRAQGN